MEQAIGKILSNYQNISTTLPASIEAVELTQEEQQKAINDAKAVKYFQILDEQKRADEVVKKTEFRRKWPKNEMASYALETLKESLSRQKKTLHQDSDFTPVFDLLSAYFSQDESFEQSGRYSLAKGILLIGNVGTGKTEMLRSFKKNKTICYLPVSANDIVMSLHQKGVSYWKTYCGYVPGHGRTDNYFQQPHVGWMIDDLGTEEIVKDYGNTVDALDKIVQERYLQSEILPFNTMHATTNLNEKMLTERYGQRFVSRLYDMFNIIVLEGKDRRKG